MSGRRRAGGQGCQGTEMHDEAAELHDSPRSRDLASCAGTAAEQSTEALTPPPPTAPLAGRACRVLLLPGVPLLVFAALAISSMATKSATYDEGVLLGSGVYYLRTGDTSVNAENPPLLKAVYALPTLLFRDVSLPPVPAAVRYSYSMPDGFEYGNAVLHGQAQPLRILFCCRLIGVAAGCLLGLALYAAARRMWAGAVPAVLLWLYALSPNVLAHTRLFTPDMGCALMVFLVALSFYFVLKRGKPRDCVACGLALGGALLSKYTAILLLPVMLCQAAIMVDRPRCWKAWGRAAARLLACWCVALLPINVFYGFRGVGSTLTDSTYRSGMVQAFQKMAVVGRIPLPVPADYVRGFDIVAFNNRPGLPNIFLGKLYPQGGSWWYYYVAVSLLKIPLALLLALVPACVVFARDRRKHWRTIAFFAVPPLVLFWNFSFVAYRQLGLRYLLPTWPFLLLFVGGAVQRARQLWQCRHVRRAAAVLGAWYAVSSLSAYPHYLSYSNELAGGSSRGWRWLASSDYDWGQDLPALARWQRRHGRPATYVLYHGTAAPAAYGVAVQPWGELPLPEYLAISTTNYFLMQDVPLIAFLREHRQPIARAGNSIHIFALDEALQREFRERAARPPGTP